VTDQDEPARQVRSIERHCEAETQRRHRAFDRRWLHATLGVVDLEAADILRCRGVRRSPEERSEAPREPDIIALRRFAQATHGHVFEHAPAQQADGAVKQAAWASGLLLELKGDPSC
jgi:hypothetical protein